MTQRPTKCNLKPHLNSVLAHSQCVPQFDGLVSRSRHNLSVVGRKGDTQYIIAVTSKLTGGLSTVKK